jgi:elongation factor G
LLEPIAAVGISVPDSLVGAVLSDLAGRRGRVTGTDPDPDNVGWSVVHAEVPDIELTTYVVSLRAITGGTGLFTRRFARYDVMPATVAAHRAAD